MMLSCGTGWAEQDWWRSFQVPSWLASEPGSFWAKSIVQDKQDGVDGGDLTLSLKSGIWDMGGRGISVVRYVSRLSSSAHANPRLDRSFFFFFFFFFFFSFPPS